jgi:hypothetical protein
MKSLFSKEISAGLPGSKLRLFPIDESSLDWSTRSGRKSGPDTYVQGDLCRSVFSESSRMTTRQRNEVYGGSVLLVGVVEARSIHGGSKGTADPFVTVQLLDEEGDELKETSKDKNLVGKILSLGHDSTPAQRTRTVKDTIHPEWDEVFALGAGIHDISEATTLRLKLSDYSSRKDKLDGLVDISFNDIIQRANTSHSKSFWDGWFDFVNAVDMDESASNTTALGSLHLYILYHAPPPDPSPLSIAVRLVHAVDLISADSNGFSDPYVKVKPLMRSGKHIKTTSGKKASELSTSVKKVTLNPAWNEIVIFNDSSLGTPSTLQGSWKSPWGWPGASPSDLVSCPVHQLTVNDLGKTYTLALVLKDLDWGKADDDLGEVPVRLTSIWGDEDAVLYGNTLRLDRWSKVRPHKSMSADLDGRLGILHFDIVLRFQESLLPRPWVEAVDSETGDSYWYNAKTRRGYWKMPKDVSRGISSKKSTKSTKSSSITKEEEEKEEDDIGYRCTPSQQPHKPPRPAVKIDGTPIPGVELIPEADQSKDTSDYYDEDDEEDDDDHENEEEKEEEEEDEEEEEEIKVVVTPKTATSSTPKIVAKPAPLLFPVPVPVPVPVPSTPAPASVSSKVKKTAAAADDDDDDDGDEPVYDAEAVAKATASIEIGKVKDVKIVDSIANPLAHLGDVSKLVNREKLFFEQMKKNAAEKKREEEERAKSKMASMNEEELAEAEKEKANDARRQQRMSRMTGQLAKGYGNSSVRLKMAAKSKRSAKSPKEGED